MRLQASVILLFLSVALVIPRSCNPSTSVLSRDSRVAFLATIDANRQGVEIVRGRDIIIIDVYRNACLP